MTAIDQGLVLDLEDVSKTYRGKVQALRNVAMRVHAGEVFGLLGPNGAGKSTLVKILMTVVRPTRCKGTMLGAAIGDKSALARVGYLPEHHSFPSYLTGFQVLDFVGALAKAPRTQRRRRAVELLELVGMKEWADKQVGRYSKGMRQRIGVAQALVNDPDLVLLDEPTDGVDPVGRRDIRLILQQLKAEGKTVFLNSHLLSELEMVCDRVSILVKGEVAKQGTIDELIVGKRRYEIELAAEPEQAREGFQAALPHLLTETVHAAPSPGTDVDGSQAGAGAPLTHSALARRVGYSGSLPTGEHLEIDQRTLRIGTTEPGVIQPILDALRERGQVIREVRQYRPTLEDLFIEAVMDPATGKARLLGGSTRPSKRAKKDRA
jgi:ABC-2 type transport system ATP-binding protein